MTRILPPPHPIRAQTHAFRLQEWLLFAIVFFSRIANFFYSSSKLHNASFARLDEMERLLEVRPDHDSSLLLGVGHMNHVIRVRPEKSRSELGNMLVVAPTRGGKGLLAVSQPSAGSTRSSSTTSRATSLPRPHASGQALGRFSSLTRPG
jgi:hypothetical protein